jgi:hypothetical protein
MGLVRSIIVFNGGSAGDFLKSVCIEQLMASSIHTPDQNGMIELDNYYFKIITGSNDADLEKIDHSKLQQIENTHYYHEFYRSLTNNIFYIDYPENLQTLIFESYFKKRCDSNYEKMYQQHLPLIPENIRHLVTVDNIEKILNRLWFRNIRSWRSVESLTKIQFSEILTYNTLTTIVEKIIQQPLSDPERLRLSYQQWADKNLDLIDRCTPSEII